MTNTQGQSLSDPTRYFQLSVQPALSEITSLIPLTGFPGFIWLIATGVLLPQAVKQEEAFVPVPLFVLASVDSKQEDVMYIPIKSERQRRRALRMLLEKGRACW
ncbi:MAG TPA: hypothetical protein VNO32_24410 [Candidatus Acidoferrum sp.]|nr:hypothetical protein [Candidatus Acidoferrum sp.]